VRLRFSLRPAAHSPATSPSASSAAPPFRRTAAESSTRYLTVKNSSSIKENSYSGVFADVVNTGVLYLDSTSTIGVLDGNAAVLSSGRKKTIVRAGVNGAETYD